MIRLLARLLAEALFSKEPERTYYFQSLQTNWHYADSGPAEPKTNTASSSCSLGSDLAKFGSLRRKSSSTNRNIRTFFWSK